MKKMTKWIVACAVCVLGSVPTAGADMNITPEITMTPPEIITPAPEQNEPVITPEVTPTPIPEVKNGWITVGKKKQYYKNNKFFVGMKRVEGNVYYFDAKGFMKTGWVTHNKHKFYFNTNRKRCSGIKKIKGKYYYFAENGVMKTKTVKSGNNIYYCTAKGVMEAWKKGNVYYNSKGKRMTAAQAYDYETLQRAKQIVSQITTPQMSKNQKFETCYKWVISHYYGTTRKYVNQTSWPALYANDYFINNGKRGNCFSDACSFAYLAKALGYKNVYACVDTLQANGSGHCWAEIDGLVYDPLFSEAKGYYKYFGASYRSYGLYPMRKVAI